MTVDRILGDGLMNNLYWNARITSPMQNQVNGIRQITSYREHQDALREAQRKEAATQQPPAVAKRLGDDATSFLAGYTANLNGLAQSAGQVAGQLNSLQGEGGIAAAANSLETLTAGYNRTLEDLNENARRGTGVEEQRDALAASEEEGLEEDGPLAALGLERGENGVLSFNRERFTAAVSGEDGAEAAGPLSRFADALRETAQRGLERPSQSLVSLATQKEEAFATYSRNGRLQEQAQQMSAGVLMNLAV